MSEIQVINDISPEDIASVDLTVEAKYLPILDCYIEALSLQARKPNKYISGKLGFTESTISTVLNSPGGQVILQKRINALLEKTDVDKLRMIEELKSMAYSNIKDLAKCRTAEEFEKLDDSVTAAVSEIKVGIDGSLTFKMYNKLTAIDSLAGLLKLTEPSKTTVNVQVNNRLFDF